MHWENITLVGLGLLGGSLGLAIRKRRLADQVTGYVRRASNMDRCLDLGVVDRVFADLEEAVSGAQLVVLCTPIAQMGDLARRFVPALAKGAIVTDVGSVKQPVVDALEPIVSRASAVFVGSHPMAGGERMGVEAARADLFEGAVCAVTPSSSTPRQSVERVEHFWGALGGCPIRMRPERHDDLVSRSSHLPHVIASELASYVLSPALPKEQGWFCGPGFRDTTRVAAGSPEMWRDIALANRENLARVLGVFIEDLQEFQLALQRNEPGVIEEFFELAKQRRDKWQAGGGYPTQQSQ